MNTGECKKLEYLMMAQQAEMGCTKWQMYGVPILPNAVMEDNEHISQQILQWIYMNVKLPST
jgi:hypothetical protein